MGFLGKRKQTLIIGNDGIALYIIKDKNVQNALTMAWSEPDFTKRLQDEIAKIGSNTPLTLIFDVIEQQYRKESIPKVNPFDKGKVINRKLAMAFPNHEVRAYLPLKKKESQDVKDKSSTYLFAALPKTREVGMVIDAVLESNVVVSGMALLPMEGVPLINALSKSLTSKEKEPVKWTVLVGYHQTGGLRQIVTRNGELALTRLTPLGQENIGEPIPSLAKDIAKEFTATLTYLARFGYMTTDGLDLIIVCDDGVGDTVQHMDLPVTTLHTMTLAEASKKLGLGTVGNSEVANEASDSMHAAWVAKQRKRVMPLTLKKIDTIKNTRAAVRAFIMVLLLVAVLSAGYFAYLMVQIAGLSSETTSLKAQRVSLQREYDKEALAFESLELEPEKVQLTLDVYNGLKDKEQNPSPFLRSIHDQLPGGVKLEKIDYVISEPSSGPGGYVDPTQQATVNIKMVISFPSQQSMETNARETEIFYDKLKAAFPEHEVSLDKIVGDLSVDKTVQGVSERVQSVSAPPATGGTAAEDNTSQLSITGKPL